MFRVDRLAPTYHADCGEVAAVDGGVIETEEDDRHVDEDTTNHSHVVQGRTRQLDVPGATETHQSMSGRTSSLTTGYIGIS